LGRDLRKSPGTEWRLRELLGAQTGREWVTWTTRRESYPNFLYCHLFQEVGHPSVREADNNVKMQIVGINCNRNLLW